ncbi:O-antigen ligase family protein [Capnocytophaga cynodegmi]|uniref:O-antigen ligase-related domain-containing protein n=1 Tax=Capnocytophaga cynodegmi TaxID=28189 RepID=A0A0B7HBN1_9FLAO|nr:O-antigen ligase family protein [Capnocytophaga cynodegmi]CEN36680.1 conserved membrane hypothetical protein [Capnocytophaga cynodegmi]
MKKYIQLLFFILTFSLTMNLDKTEILFLFIFFTISFILFCCWLIKVHWFKKTIEIASIFELVVCIVLFSLSVRNFIQGNIYGIDTYEANLLLWGLYFPLTFFNKNNKVFSVQLSYIFIGFMGFEVILGILQSLGILQNANPLFKVGGSFGNPAMLAIYLSVISPLLLSMILTFRRMVNKKDTLTSLFTIAFLLSLYIIIISKTRGAWLSCLVGCLIVVYLRNNLKIEKYIKKELSKRIKITASLLILLLFIFGGYGLYKMKAQSIDGRLLIWSIVLSENRTSLFGKGLGTIETEYGKWQAEYFIKKGISEHEKNTADYVVTIYNTFMEILIEQGWLELLLWGVIFYLIIFYSKKISTIEIGCYASAISIFTLMFSSYPFRVFPIVFYFIFLLSVLSTRKKTKIQIKFPKITVLVLTVTTLVTIIYTGFFKSIAFVQLKKGRELIEKNRFEEGISEMKKAESQLQKNGIFNFHLGSSYYMAGDLGKAIFYLDKSTKQSSIPNSFILLGKSYSKLGNVLLAEKYYTIATHIQPSKMYTKYLLFELFKNRDVKKALYWAENIKKHKIKTKTTASEEILQEINDYLNKGDIQ